MEGQNKTKQKKKNSLTREETGRITHGAGGSKVDGLNPPQGLLSYFCHYNQGHTDTRSLKRIHILECDAKYFCTTKASSGKKKYVMHIIKCRNRIPTRLLLWAPCSFASPDPHVLQGRDVNTWHCFPSTLQEMHHSSLWGNCHVFLTGKCKNNY